MSSFWEHKNGKYGEYVLQDKHILDSGAFTAINDKTGKYKNYDWNNYLKKYIDFIKITKQKLFFELDIDCVVGLKIDLVDVANGNFNIFDSNSHVSFKS